MFWKWEHTLKKIIPVSEVELKWTNNRTGTLSGLLPANLLFLKDNYSSGADVRITVCPLYTIDLSAAREASAYISVPLPTPHAPPPSQLPPPLSLSLSLSLLSSPAREISPEFRQPNSFEFVSPISNRPCLWHFRNGKKQSALCLCSSVQWLAILFCRRSET